MQEKELKNILTATYDFEKWHRVIDFVFPKVNFENSIVELEDSTNKTKHIHQKGDIQLTDGKKIIILEVCIKEGNQISKTKVGFHNLTAKFIDQANNHGILVFYISADESQVDYRLSFICKESRFNEDGIIEEFKTNPKRYTYLLGSNETATTAAKRLKELASKKNTFDFELKDVIDAFSVEKLTDEFFRKYKEQFQIFNNYLIEDDTIRYNIFEIDRNEIAEQKASNELPIRDFTKKLLGRIVFLYFLQRKGWMGVLTPKTGEEIIWSGGFGDFIHKLFNEAKTPSKFHSKYLKELFYNTLNNANRENFVFLIDGKSPFKDNINRSVPYLNGGLFDDDLPKANKIDFPEKMFQNLFEFLEQYNFTIDENSPEDHEVGIDPEMLGHIFENLLEDNRDKGAYYTPKEVVHYMSQQSIIEYLNHKLNCTNNDIENLIKAKVVTAFITANLLKIESLLKKVKVCDPAIGSGAFPMGVLKVIFAALQTLHHCKNDNTEFDEAKIKKDIIQKSIYGVDLERGAVDIARLRFWLSLVVDEDKPKPLPNLDYKIIQGNSILEKFEEIPLKFDKARYQIKIVKDVDLFGKILNPQISLTEFLQTKDAAKEFDITELEETYFKSFDPIEKKAIKSKIENFEKEFIEEQVESKREMLQFEIDKLQAKITDLKRNDFTNLDHYTVGTRLKFEKLKKELANKETECEKLKVEKARLRESFENLIKNFRKNKPYFLWHLYFMDVFDNGGFDIVIGNPPYIKEYTNKSAFNGIRDSQYYMGKMDIWYFFACFCIDMLKDNGGIQCFIAQSNWITSSGAAKLRQKVVTQTEMLSFIDFGNYKVFQSAGIQTMIYVVKKTPNPSVNYTTKYARLLVDNIDKTFLDYFLQSEGQTKHENFEKLQFEFVPANYQDSYITFANDENDSILKKIQATEHILLTEKEIAQGIVPNPDVVNTRNFKRFSKDEVLTNKIEVGDGVFVVKKGTFDALDEIQKKYVKPIFEPKEVHRYKFIDNYETEIIYITKKNYNNDAPSLIEHLAKFKPIMEERRENQKGTLDFFHLHWPRDEFYFEEGEKILSVRKCDRPTFIYSKKSAYVMMAFNIIKTERVNLKFLTALLNSKLIAFWLKNKGKMQGNNYQIDKEPLLEIPIIITDKEHIVAILVDYILLVHQPREEQLIKYIGNDLIIHSFEEVIDQVMYELYFGNEPEMQELRVLEHLENLKPLSNTNNDEDIRTVVAFYHSLHEQKNPIRNILLKANIVSKNIVAIINSSIS
jgi:adenine-specific DNA-methyltransferase